MFKVLPGDRGRPITDLASLIPLPGFTDDVTAVLGDGEVIERHVEARPDGRHLVLDWHESGNAMPREAGERRGYGRILIERALTFSLQAKTELTFEAGGIRCRIEMALQPPAGAAPRRSNS